MKRLLVLVLLVACRHSSQLPPPTEPRALTAPVHVEATAPMGRGRIVNRCPHDNAQAPYGYIERTAPWLNAACLKFVSGDRVYQQPGVVPTWKVLAKNDQSLPTGKLVYVIGQGPVVPNPPRTTFVVTFHFERVGLTPSTAETVTVDLFVGAIQVARETASAPPDVDAIDLDHTFTRTQLANGITARITGEKSEWTQPRGRITVHDVDTNLTGTPYVTVNNTFESHNYSAPALKVVAP